MLRTFPIAAAVAAALATAAAAEDRPLGVFERAKRIDTTLPRFPAEARSQWLEGWVLASFCIGVDGKLRDPVIERSSGQKEFEREVLRTLPKWTYQPATQNGSPVEQCSVSVRISFSLQGAQYGARGAFVRKYRQASRLIEEGKLFEAGQVLDELKPSNNYESGRLAFARARVAEAAGKPAERLKHMRMALYFEDGIEKKHRGPAKRSVFALEVSQGEYAAALDRFRELMKDHGDELSVPEKLAGEQLEALVAGPKAIATPGELECRCDKENGEPLWSARLLRREFGFIDIEGEVERFEVRCETKQFAAKVAADKRWKIPPSWGDCTLFVFGAEGAKFRVVEMPEQVASVEAPAPATP